MEYPADRDSSILRNVKTFAEYYTALYLAIPNANIHSGENLICHNIRNF